MSDDRVDCAIDGRIAHITFDNAGAHNALTWKMWAELGEHCRRLARNSDVRVITFRGAGAKAFISGTDITGFTSFETGEQGVEYEREVGAHVAAVEELPQATLAIIDGWAIGGGLAIAFACDFRIATEGARFGAPIARTIGNCLASRSYARIVAHVGITLAKRMLLLGETLTAEQLEAQGLLQDVVPRDAIDVTADALVARLLENAPLTISVTKEAIRRHAYAGLPDIDDLIARTYASEDFKTGVKSFIAKAKPEWTGK